MQSFISAFGRRYSEYAILTALFSKFKTKSLFTSEKHGSFKQSKYFFLCACVDTFDRYLFQSNVGLKPDFSCFSSFVLSSFDKTSTERQKFVYSYCKSCCSIYFANNTICILISNSFRIL